MGFQEKVLPRVARSWADEFLGAKLVLCYCSIALPHHTPIITLFLHRDTTVGSDSPSLAIRLHLLSQQYNTAIITVGRVIEQHSVQQSTQLSINETIRVNEVVAHVSIAKQISKGVQL